MHWSDEAIVISVRKHGESSAVVRAFAREHGVYAGVIKGAHSKTNRGVLQSGNLVTVTWNARLSEHLGMFKMEMADSVAAHVMQDAMKLAALSSACVLIESAMPERHPYPKLYKQFGAFLLHLKTVDDWLEEYIHLELAILAESGFGLDLTQCAATGTTADLVYVSPKSGRAVSKEAGEPYKEKLLKLPAFLLPKALSLEGGELGGGDLTIKSRELRKNQTDVERKLWHHLSQKQLEGYRFRRQHPIGDKYIVDFICLESKLVIELDGGQHSQQQEYDSKRTEFLESEGYRVLRFWNNDIVENIEGVVTSILEALHPHGSAAAKSLASPAPPSRGSVQDGLVLTGYFLEHWLLTPHNRKLPAARKRLADRLK
jgi:DNA repair protein RecO (recombination protein O)